MNKFHDKIKNGNKLNSKDDLDDDDAIIMKSEEDEDSSEIENGIIRVLANVVDKIQDSLSIDPSNIRVGGTTFSSEDYVPLGRFRLRAIELLLNIVIL